MKLEKKLLMTIVINSSLMSGLSHTIHIRPLTYLERSSSEDLLRIRTCIEEKSAKMNESQGHDSVPHDIKNDVVLKFSEIVSYSIDIKLSSHNCGSHRLSHDSLARIVVNHGLDTLKKLDPICSAIKGTNELLSLIIRNIFVQCNFNHSYDGFDHNDDKGSLMIAFAIDSMFINPILSDEKLDTQGEGLSLCP
jgi:hypothetical protein